MLFTSVPAVFSSTSSDTSRPGGNSGCFEKGRKKPSVAVMFLLAWHIPTFWWCGGGRGSHLDVEGDLGEQEPCVDAHQLPVPVVQMALQRHQGRQGKTQSDVT